MKKFRVFGAAGLLALVSTASAIAADIPRRPPPAKAPSYVPAPLYNWTGFYVGINGGGGWGESNFTAPFATGDFDLSGWLAGGTVGYNWQANRAVFGLEADIDWSNIDGSAACGGTTCTTENKWLGTVRGRLGYAMGRYMPYVTGGLAFGEVKTTVAGTGSRSSTETGWTVGGGLEAALAGNWTGKVEYLYVDLDNAGTPVGGSAEFKTHIVRAGINYRF